MDNEEQSKEVILQQMHDTRSSLADKLENLEQQVVDTVHTATSAVSDTVTRVKDAVHDTVATVKDSVQSTVTSVKDSFDIPAHVDRHPWAMMAGSVALGYLGERFLSPSGSKSVRERRPTSSGPEANGSHQAPEKPAAGSATENRFTGVAQLLGPEIATLKGLAIGSVLGLVRDMVAKSAPPRLRDQLVELINKVTEKLGGEVFPEMISKAGRADPDADGQKDHDTPASGNNHRKRFSDDDLTQTERD
jgi:hypothetical protein